MRALKGVRHLTLISGDPQVSGAPGDQGPMRSPPSRAGFVPFPVSVALREATRSGLSKPRREDDGLNAADVGASYQ